MSGKRGGEGYRVPQVWGNTQGEAPKAGEMSISQGKGGYWYTVGPMRERTRHDSICLCASMWTQCYLWNFPDPRGSHCWLVHRQIEQALSPGVMSTPPTQDGLLCGRWWLSAHTPSPEGSRAGFFLLRPTDLSSPWVPAMEKLRAGVWEVPL